jgi:trigger factor
MTVKWEKVENNKVKLEIEVGAEEVNKGLDLAFKKVVKDVNVPGFRKGKVPRVIFEQKFGVEALFNDALDIIMPEAYDKAVTEAGIVPVSKPDVEVEDMGKNKPLRFTATVFVKPEVVLGEYKGLELKEEKEFEIADEDIDRELEVYRQRNTQLEVIEDGEVENGDTTKIDFEGFKDGVAFAGGKGEDYPLEIGSNSFIPGFEEQMVGMKLGEEKNIDVSFPAEYHAEELAGAPVTFKVKVNEIKRKVVPAIDDELAKDVSEFETLEELKEDIKNKVIERKAVEAEQYKRELVVSKAIENATVDIPEPMIEEEVQRMVGDFGRDLQYQGMNMDMYMQYTGQTVELLESQFREGAERRVNSQLVLEAIVAAENIVPTESEIDAEIDMIAVTYKKQPEEVRALIEAQGNMEAAKSEIALRKAVDFLVENSTFIKE